MSEYEGLNHDIFIGEKHEDEFLNFMVHSKSNLNNIQFVCYFYILSFFMTTTNRDIRDYFDFEYRGVRPKEWIEKYPHSSGEFALVRLANHLFTGSSDGDYKNATIVNTFHHLGGDFEKVALNAILLYLRKIQLVKI